MIPKHANIRRGASVNIVLKPDQRSGKITSGQVQDVLTKGNHPRGVKVRLLDGQIGRVQSLSSSTPDPVEANPEESRFQGQSSKPCQQRHHLYRDRPASCFEEKSMSLADYIKPSKQRRSQDSEAAANVQKALEEAFPDIDSALIAAILVDYSSFEDARDVLKSLDMG